MSKYDNPAFDDHDIEIDLTPPSVGAQYHPAETEDVLLTLRDYFAKNRPQLVRFIIEHSACKDPAELACRALIVTGWLDLKTRGFAKLKSK